MRFKTRFENVNVIRNFVVDATKRDYDIDINLDKYTVDGKSLMGLFSLDLSREIIIELHTEDEEEIKYFRNTYENK